MKKVYLLLAVTVLLSFVFSSCAEVIPPFPADEYKTSQIDEDNRMMYTTNFYFDNTENTRCIDIFNGGKTLPFMNAVAVSNNNGNYSKEYKMEKGKDGLYKLTEGNVLIENAYYNDDFYILNSNEKSKEGPGILRLIYGDNKEIKNSPLDKNAVSVVFTDLSEPNLNNVAKIIKEKYINDNYGICIVGVDLPIDTDNVNYPFYISSTTGKIIDFQPAYVKSEVKSRKYYLIITGPVSPLAAYVHSLKFNLQNNNDLKEGTDYSFSNFYIQEYNFSKESLYTEQFLSDNPTKIEDDKLMKDNIKVNNSFSKYTYRLDYDEFYDDNKDCFHYIYSHDKNIRGLSHKEGYSSKAYDFSLHTALNIDPNIETNDVANKKRVKYVSMDKNGKFSLDSSSNLSKSDKNILYYSFGEPVIYYAEDNTWKMMDEKRKRRFFHKIDISNGELSIISDNTDEGGIENLYIKVPVYQVIVEDNFAPAWVEEYSFSGADDQGRIGDIASKTHNFRNFYSTIFGLTVENTTQSQYTNATKQSKVVIGYGKFFISGI